ncbi:DUF3558 domain-containing protein [Rhodococcus triatomae]|uniref:DUF3558 domain-containing protein n=1 Tax=Rhodococcus triatomae TaxID=300028 RepID=A0A1G8RXE4_9NOCA|nr:DUF3558 family protein [Rhodococcus triatomae]QNG17373.1 DUF3558 domain-containing protein [Rhodococcus triatomae]QNG22960.1 DUF3558 domain-containing protein [Rhodococcus triatomae]SDJ21572.1 Protein of unknown function [Rhodococcus triatomae]
MKRTTLLTLVATIGLAVTACSSNDDTVAADAGTTTTTAAESAPHSADSEDAPTTATASVSPNLAGLDPCSLLSSEEAAATTGGPTSEPQREIGENTVQCSWGSIVKPETGDISVAVWDMGDFGPPNKDQFGTIGGRTVYIIQGANERHCSLSTTLSNERRLLMSLVPAEPKIQALPGYGTSITPRPDYDPNDPMASAFEIELEVSDTIWCESLFDAMEKVADRTGW